MGFISNLITMIIVINPLSKMLVTSTLTKKIKSKEDIKNIINYSNLIALAVLLFFAVFGNFIFTNIFGISNIALIIACGLSLMIFGINYLFKDEIFKFKKQDNKNLMYLSIGTPLIVGPASITTISFITNYSSIFYSILIAFIAIIVNYIVMVITSNYFKFKKQSEAMFYLNLRLTGLFMLAIGIQFLINGINIWMNL